MKVKFSAIPERVVTIYRGEDSVEFPLRALPIGYSAFLDSVNPKPVVYEDGVAVPVENDAGYWARYTYLILARALEHTDILESRPPQGHDQAAWKAYAEAVRAEFVEANFTDGEVGELVDQLGKLNEAQTTPEQKRAVGNG